MSAGPQLAAVLRERASEILAAWIVRFERSPLRFRRAIKAATHTAQVASLLEALTDAAHGGADALKPGSEATRDLERSCAFMGAQFASEGATGYDIAALLLELRDVVDDMTEPGDKLAVTRLFEWLTVVALDGFAASGLQSLREQTSEQLDAGTPVIEILPKVPAVLLVGAPSSGVIDSLLARAWMLAVGTGAPCLIIDVGGLASAGEKNFERGYRGFLEQAEGSALQVLLSTARRPLRELAAKLTAESSLSFQHFDRLDSAVAHALERAGHLLMRRS
ncbi:MAG TPA: RsbRD N-terminal domain-containing protein [Kofleriaceae bacterium]|nr:RsbRD N-terminal domain-containing protein [Kofleriaceae bacterium]